MQENVKNGRKVTDAKDAPAYLRVVVKAPTNRASAGVESVAPRRVFAPLALLLCLISPLAAPAGSTTAKNATQLLGYLPVR